MTEAGLGPHMQLGLLKDRLIVFIFKRTFPSTNMAGSTSQLLRRSLSSLSRRPMKVSLASRSAVQKTRFSALASLAPADNGNSSSSSAQWNSWFAGAAAVMGVTAAASWNMNTADCCGIIGVVGSAEHADAREFLLDGLTILKNRGYDSAGIATVPIQGKEMHITKFASDGDKADSINLVKHHSHSMGHTLGIAHTRWYVYLLIRNCSVTKNNANVFFLTGPLMEEKQTRMPTLILIPREKLLWFTMGP